MKTISKAKIKFVKSLQHRKYRVKHGVYAVGGHRIVLDLLKAGVQPQHMIVDETLSLDASWPVTDTASSEMMKQLTSWRSPPSMLIVLPIPETLAAKDFDPEVKLSIYLDGVQDPGNVGNIMRSCAWFNCTQLVIGPGTADVFGSKVVQAAMGAHQTMTVIHATAEDIKSYHPSVFVVGMDMSGLSFHEMDKSTHPSIMLMLGSEGPGLSPAARSAADAFCSIDTPAPGQMESLNVASSAAIALHYLTYQ